MTADGAALLVVAEGALWRIPAEGEPVAARLFGLGPGALRVWGTVDGCHVVTTREHAIELWSERGELRASVPSQVESIEALLLGREGSLVIPWSSGDTIFRLDHGASTTRPFVTAPGNVECAALSPDGALLAVGDDAGTLSVFDGRTGVPLRTLPQAHDDRPTGVAITDAGVVVSVSEFDGTIRSFDVGGSPVSRIDLARPARVSLGPDGRAYVTFAYRGIGRYSVAPGGELEPVLDP